MGYSVTPEQWRFYEVYGLFRLGVIAQQIYYRYFHGQTTNEAYASVRPGGAVPRGALQPDHRHLMGQVLLVRHGQASWGADDYDALSETGWEQSRLLGRALAARGVEPDARRPRLRCAGTARPPRLPGELAEPRARSTPAGTSSTTSRCSAPCRRPFEGREPTRAEFQAWFEAATDRWTGGEHDDGATTRRSTPSATGSRPRCVVRRRRRGRARRSSSPSGGPIAVGRRHACSVPISSGRAGCGCGAGSTRSA